MGSEKKIALITGAMGIQGRHLAELLAGKNDWSVVYGVARRNLDYANDKIKPLKLDLHDKKKLESTLKDNKVTDVTHIFSTAYTSTGDDVKDVETNLALLQNIVEGLEHAGCPLRHVYLTTGCKWYGQQLPINKTPYLEDDPRHLPPNFYYNQEDYLSGRAAGGAPWTWSSLRPGPVLGFSHGSVMNLVVSVALYAVISKELGLPFRFPGTKEAYEFAVDMVDVGLLVEAQEYLATHEQCANQAFNITNGDVTRWCHIWPRIAQHFGMEVGPISTISLTDRMADKESLWNEVTKKYGLQTEVPWNKLATWGFADFVFQQPDDWFANTNKLKRAGFDKMSLDTDDVFVRWFKEMEKEKFIPSYGKEGQ